MRLFESLDLIDRQVFFSEMKPGDQAFNRLPGFPWWPIRILSVLSPRNKFLVFMYGDRKTATVTIENMMDFETNKQACGASKHASIKKAMADLNKNPNSYMETAASLGIEKEVRLEISELRAEISQANDSISDIVKKNIAKELGKVKLSQDDLEKITQTVYSSVMLELKSSHEKLVDRIGALESKVDFLAQALSNLQYDFDEMQQAIKSSYVVIYHLPGLNETTRHPINNVLDLITNKLGLRSVSESDIVDVNILGKPSSSRILPVEVGFRSSAVSREVLKNRSKLKESQCFVSESLTRRRQEVLNAARDVVGMRNAWSVQGRILAKSGDQVVRIKDLSEVVSLSRLQEARVLANRQESD